jgi:hypothetical protein
MAKKQETATVKGAQYVDPKTGLQAVIIPFVKNVTIDVGIGTTIKIPGWGSIVIQAPTEDELLDLPADHLGL